MPDASTLEKQEVLARAVVDASDTRTTHTPGSLEEAAHSIREQTRKDNPRQVSELYAGKEPVNVKRRERMNQSIGVEVDDHGRKVRAPGSDEESRFNRAVEETQAIEEFLKTGNLTSKLKEEINNIIASWPEANDFLSKLPEPEQTRIIQDWIKDPRLNAIVRRKYQEALDLEDGPTGEEIRALRKKHQDAESKRLKKEPDLTKVKTALTEIGKEEADFKDEGGDEGPKTVRLKALASKEADRTSDINRLRGRRRSTEDNLDKRINEYEQARAGVATDTDPKLNRPRQLKNQAKRDLQNLIRDLETLEKEKEEYDTLKKAKETLPIRKQHLEQEEERLTLEIADLTRDEIAAKTDYNIKTGDKQDSEEEYVTRLENIFNDSIRELMLQRTGSAEAARQKTIDKEIEKATDTFTKALKAAQKSRWTEITDKRLWRGHGTNYKTDQITTDYQELLAGGPDPVIDNILGVTRDADGKLTGPPGMTEEKLKEIKEAQGKEIALDIARYRMQTGGITKRESEAIAKTEWGATLVQDAALKNKEVKKAMEAAAKSAKFSGSVSEFIKKHPIVVASIIPLILFLLYGGGLGMAVGGAVVVGKFAASNINTGL